MSVGEVVVTPPPKETGWNNFEKSVGLGKGRNSALKQRPVKKMNSNSKENDFFEIGMLQARMNGMIR